MPHMITDKGKPGYATPVIVLTSNKGKKETRINELPGGSSVALAIAYTFETAGFSTDESNRYTNKTNRNYGEKVITAIGEGDMEDKFTLYLPSKCKDGVFQDFTLKHMEATRRQLVTVATRLKKIADIYDSFEPTVAEALSGYQHDSIKPLFKVPDFSPEGDGEVKKKGKAKGAVLKI